MAYYLMWLIHTVRHLFGKQPPAFDPAAYTLKFTTGQREGREADLTPQEREKRSQAAWKGFAFGAARLRGKGGAKRGGEP